MPHTVEKVTIRPLRDEDFEAIVGIARANFPDEPRSSTEKREAYHRFEEARFARLWVVAEDPAGDVVGYGFFRHVPWSFHPDKYHAYAAVHPAAHRRGIGSQLMSYLLDQLRDRGATRVKSWAREDYTHAVDFLRHRGFEEHARTFESRLAVAGVDLTPFERSVQRAKEAGVVITTLKDELRRDPNCLFAVYQAEGAMDISAPRDDPDLPRVRSYARFLEDVIRDRRTLPDAYFLAKMDDFYVGESALKRSEGDPGVLWQQFTGVLHEYRGLGIATALKVRTVEYAQVMGYREIRTFNSSRNAPMLAVNTKLGFIRQPAWVDYLRAERA